MKPNGFKVSDHLKASELQCRGRQRHVACCNGAVIIIPELVIAIEDVRPLAHQAADIEFKGMKINSGYRCPRYNQHIHGHRYSRHPYGEAADIDAIYAGFASPLNLAMICVSVGNQKGLIKGVGCYNGYHKKHNFVHIQVVDPEFTTGKIGDVTIWGDFLELRDFYREHPELYKGG